MEVIIAIEKIHLSTSTCRLDTKSKVTLITLQLWSRLILCTLDFKIIEMFQQTFPNRNRWLQYSRYW